MKQNRILKLAFLVLLSSPLVVAQENGVIRGHVVDPQGKPAVGAHVSWIRSQEGAVEIHRSAAFAESDSQGKFSISGLSLGVTYKLYASKEETFYPDMSFPFFNPLDQAASAVATADDSSDATVSLGPQAGRLFWEVTGTNGAPVSPSIAVKRPDYGESFLGGFPSKDDFLMPADTDITFSVSAKQYQTWYYPGVTDEKLSTPLRLKPGEQKTLKIHLQPQN